jgi:hypothetical protein
MNKTESINKLSPEKKTALCIVLSMFYFAMLAYPFGVAMEGYVWQKAVIAGIIFFAISIPAWIVNLKREFYSVSATEGATEEMLDNELDLFASMSSNEVTTMSEMARRKNWLTVDDIAQIQYCQEREQGSSFSQIAIKRNFLTREQVDTLLALQSVDT